MPVYSVVTGLPWEWQQPVAYGEWNVTYPTYGVTGWECPKCHFVYGPQQYECYTCNADQRLKNKMEEKDNKDGSVDD